MKTIKINNTDTFYLGDLKYNYSFNLEDKEYFLENLKNIVISQDTEKLKNIFYNILKKQNKNVVILEQDLFGLLQYFLGKFL